jgi:hypothetical protein
VCNISLTAFSGPQPARARVSSAEQQSLGSSEVNQDGCSLGPFKWRRFTLAAAKYFHGPMLWVFFGSLPILVYAWSVDSEPLKKIGNSGALFAFASWLSLTGVGLIWRCGLGFLSARSITHQRSFSKFGVVWFGLVFTTGLVFLGLGLQLVWGIVKIWK